jgi:inorganic pyrophosphatase
MELIQIFIPTADQEGSSFPPQHFDDLKKELTDQFGGVTIYARSPAKGIWKPDSGSEETDNMVIYEILVQEMNTTYWAELKSRLEDTFQQKEIMMRYFTVFVVK